MMLAVVKVVLGDINKSIFHSLIQIFMCQGRLI